MNKEDTINQHNQLDAIIESLRRKYAMLKSEMGK